MKLERAASRFVKTPISTWDGTRWRLTETKIALMPTSTAEEMQTLIKVKIGETKLDTLTLFKVESTGQIYLVGQAAQDVQGTAYCKMYYTRRAKYQGDIVSFQKTMAASGMAMGVTRQVESTVFCDMDYASSVASPHFHKQQLSTVLLYLPRDAAITTANEMHIGSKFYDIKEVYLQDGIKVCSALEKNSA